MYKYQTETMASKLKISKHKKWGFLRAMFNRRWQNEIMAKMQAATIRIPKPVPSHTLKALEAPKIMKKQ